MVGSFRDQAPQGVPPMRGRPPLASGGYASNRRGNGGGRSLSPDLPYPRHEPPVGHDNTYNRKRGTSPTRDARRIAPRSVSGGGDGQGQGRLFWLKTENRRLQLELEALLDEEYNKVVPGDMAAELDTLRNAADRLKRDKTKLSETVLPQQTKDIAVLEQRLAQMQGDYTHSRAAVHELELHVKTLRERVASREAAAAERHQARQATRAMREDIQHALDTLNDRLISLQEEANTLHAAGADDWAALADEASVPMEQYMQLKEECDGLQARLVEHCRATGTQAPPMMH